MMKLMLNRLMLNSMISHSRLNLCAGVLMVFFMALMPALHIQDPGHGGDLFLPGTQLAAQQNPAYVQYPNNHLKWYTIESPHFLVHFQEGNSRPAQVISRISEEVYVDVTGLYDYRPDTKISIVLIDREDYSNGAAYFFDNKIDIWLPSLDTPLRGTNNWLRDVITHEFTHIVQIQASLKRSRRNPITYLQWLSYEDVRRPDVLYGFPSGIITYPFSAVSMPVWLAEGTAQYQRGHYHYDYWDAHRDMILRTRILNGTHLGLVEMGHFASKTSIEREAIYNQGFAFTTYLANRFGEESLREITQAFSRRGVHDVRTAIRNATGIGGQEVFDHFVDSLRTGYEAVAARITPTPSELIEPEGFFNFNPTVGPDGSLYYLSNRGRDYARLTLYKRDPATGDAPAEIPLPDDDGSGIFAPDSAAGLVPVHDPGHSMHHFPTDDLHDSGDLNEPGEVHGTGGTVNAKAKAKTKSGTSEWERAAAVINRKGFLSAPGGFTFSCGMEANPILIRLTSGYSISPDGSEIAFGLIRQNRFGETYSDIHIHTPGSRESRKLTSSGRISQPRWSPDGTRLAAIQLRDGTLNLVTLDPVEGTDVTPHTNYVSSEQIYTPVWHPDGNSIYFAYADTAQRTIRKFDLESGETRPVLNTPGTDFRDPFISPDGIFLYYSANSDGIFNIYRMNLESGGAEQMTDVIGGAFMPVVSGDKLIYSEYRADGYKIAETPVQPISGKEVDHRKSKGVFAVFGPFPDDSDITPFSDDVIAIADTGTYRFRVTGSGLGTGARRRTGTDSVSNMESESNSQSGSGSGSGSGSDTRTGSGSGTGTASGSVVNEAASQSDMDTGIGFESEFYSYSETFTSFTFYPTLRFDNYTQQYGRNSSLLKAGQFGSFGRNLWRDAKIGFYMSSREVLERFTMFGGALIGFGSRDASGVDDFFRPARLVDLDRDLFLIMEYAGLPFIKRHWSPTISVGLYNLRRNVENGIQIEEFPCTACLPDSTNINIAYDIWQAEINLYSKINRFSLVELGFWHSPYRVSTEQFFSREFREVVGSSTSRYFVGNTYTAAYVLHADEPWRHGDIAPVGLKAHLRYSYQPGSLLDRYEVRDGTLIPVYNEFKNHSVELSSRLGFRAWNENFEFRSRFFTYFSSPGEFFFLDYIGGLTGMRSYPFFGIGGNTTAFASLSYHMPLITGINRQYGRFLLDKVFTRFFVETGNGWGGPLGIGDNLKTGIGAELRVAVQSSYLFPSRFFISGAYGLDSYNLRVPEGFITSDGRETVSFGRELLINFGLLFDFDF